jgi:hypothetical protein
MYQAHPFGVDWIIASDGGAYAKILRVDEGRVRDYLSRLVRYRNMMGLQRTVHIIELGEMCHRLRSNDAGDQIFGQTMQIIAEDLGKELASGNNQLMASMHVLVRGMRWNVNIIDKTDGLGWEELWSLMNADTSAEVPPPLRAAWKEVDSVVSQSALEYAAFNLAVRYHDLYRKFLPGALRATVHAKESEVAVPRLGDVYPWNGVAVRIQQGASYRFETWPLYSVLKQSANIVAYTIPGDAGPFFYDVNRGSPSDIGPKTGPPSSGA